MVDTRPPLLKELLHRSLAAQRLQKLQPRLAHRGKGHSRLVARHIFASRRLKAQPIPEHAQRFLDALSRQSYMVDPHNTRHIIVLSPCSPAKPNIADSPRPV